MIMKKFRVFIISFFVFMNTAHTPVAVNAFMEFLSDVPAINEVLPATDKGMEVVNYSSFIQISKQHMGEICTKIYESIQTNLVFFSSSSETIIKEISKTTSISAAYCDILFVKAKSIVFPIKIFAYNYDMPKETGKFNTLFLFILLQLIMLLLYALYKGNIPHASINYNKIKKTRYQF